MQQLRQSSRFNHTRIKTQDIFLFNTKQRLDLNCNVKLKPQHVLTDGILFATLSSDNQYTFTWLRDTENLMPKQQLAA